MIMRTLEYLAQKRNFRDLGYLSSCFGIPIQNGRLFRMGKLYKLSDGELSALGQLELTDIIDLRSKNERIAQPDSPIGDVPNHHIDFSAGRLGLEHVRLIYRKAAVNPESIDAKKYIIDSYRELPELCADQVKSVISLIVERDSPSLLIHCAGGKDRTGFLTALLLGTIGVSKDAIIHDYMQSARSDEQNRRTLVRYLKRFKDEFGIAIPPQVARPFLTVDRDSIIAVYDIIEKTYGGFSTYLTERLDCSPDMIDAIQRWLLSE